MARTIPRNPLLRIPAFFLYTGSAGGMLLTLGLMAATLGMGQLWDQLNPPALGHNRYEPLEWNLIFWLGMSLYVVCYATTGALLRHYFFREQIRSGYTWVLTALLVGVGSFLPSAVAYLAFYEQIRMTNETGWWMLANPFMAGIELTTLATHMRGGNELYLMLMWWFLGTWFLLVVALSVFWVGGQIRRFRPYEKKAIPAIRVEIVDSTPLPAVTVETTAVRQTMPIDPSSVTPG